MTASAHEHQKIIDLIDNAESYVVLASPFIHKDRTLQQALARAVARRVQVHVICRPHQAHKLYEVAAWCEISEVSRFHAKLYANETEALVGSLNLRAPGPTATIEFTTTIRRDTNEIDFLGVLEAIQQVRDQGTREQELVSEDSKLTMEAMIFGQRQPDYYCPKCGEGIVFDERPYAYQDSMMCVPCQAAAFANNVDHYTHTQFCVGCGTPDERPWTHPRCTQCYQKTRATWPDRWRVQLADDTLSVRIPIAWTTTTAMSSHPIRGVLHATSVRLFRFDDASSLRATIRSDQGGLDLAKSLESVLPAKSRLWKGVTHLVVERSTRPPDQMGVTSTESAMQLDLSASDDDHKPDHWDGVEALASWKCTFKTHPKSVSGLEMAAIAKRPLEPTVIEDRTPLGLVIAMQGPADDMLDVVPWALTRLQWFIAAAHTLELGAKPDSANEEIWARWTTNLGQPGALGPATLKVCTDGISRLGDVRLHELGLLSIHRLADKPGPWALIAKLIRLERKPVH